MTGTWKIVGARKTDKLQTKTGAKQMTHNPDFPPSPAYLVRQAKRQKTLDSAYKRQAWTDLQFLDARDAVYIAEQRGFISYIITKTKQDMDNDPDSEGSVHKYHTDEG